MTLNRLDLDLNGLARIELSMILDGVSADAVDKPEAAMNDATLRTASLLFEDRSLLGKVLPVAAKMQGIEVDALSKWARRRSTPSAPDRGRRRSPCSTRSARISTITNTRKGRCA